jgi:predicted TIM-barrel fold metal-dependent hydrolase
MIIDAHTTLGVVDDVTATAEQLVAQMDAAGVDVALVHPDPRESAVAHRSGHERLLAVCGAFPGRLFSYATANPWFGEAAVVELARALDAGAAAMALHPFLQGYQPIDRLVDPLLSLAEERGVPVYVHSGTPVASTPFQVGVMAHRFPGVAFILGRSGKTDFKADALEVLAQHDNIYGDTSHDFPLTGMAAQLAAAGGSRLVFTSDFPFGDVRHEVRRVQELPVDRPTTDAVLGLTMQRLLPQPIRDQLVGRSTR